MKAVGSGGGNDGGEKDVAAVSPESAKAVEGRPNPRVSRAVVVGGGPLGGGGPVGPGVVNRGWNEMALGGGGGARSELIRGPPKRWVSTVASSIPAAAKRWVSTAGSSCRVAHTSFSLCGLSTGKKFGSAVVGRWDGVRSWSVYEAIGGILPKFGDVSPPKPHMPLGGADHQGSFPLPPEKLFHQSCSFWKPPFQAHGPSAPQRRLSAPFASAAVRFSLDVEGWWSGGWVWFSLPTSHMSFHHSPLPLPFHATSSPLPQCPFPLPLPLSFSRASRFAFSACHRGSWATEGSLSSVAM